MQTTELSFNAESSRDISTYLSFAKFGATAFVAFTQSNLVSLLSEARGFTLTTQTLENQTLKFFSKNSIDTRSRDQEGRKIYREVTGTFLVTKLITPKAHLILTKDCGDFVDDGLQRLLYRVRNRVSRLHLTSAEMKEVVSGTANETSGRLVVRRSIVRNKRQETTVSYETERLEELYSKAAAEDAHVHSFAFKLFHRGTDKLLLNAGLNREGRFTFHDGRWSLFIDIINRASQMMKKKDELVQNRARSEITGEIRPVRITFDEEVFVKPDGVKAFLATLGKIRHGEFTIFHRNPYLHVNFFDFFDGSEFEVFIDSANSLVIIPQYEASAPSLSRLCQKIFENFQEGALEEDSTTVRVAII